MTAGFPPHIAESPAVVIVAMPHSQAAADAARAVELAGGRTLSSFAWAEASAGIASQALRPIVLLEAEQVSSELLDEALPRIDAAAKALDLEVIVALHGEQIDIVASQLMRPNVQLLCSPSVSDRVGALIVADARSRSDVLSDRVGEGEAARLAQLNEEVARIAEVLARLSRRDAAPESFTRGDLGDRRLGFDAGAAKPDTPIEASEVRGAIRSRRMRDKLVGSGLFEDPAWDMLLDLLAAELERAQVSVSSLCIAAAVAPTTALRWIGKLTEAGLLERQPDPFDRRRAFMALSERGRNGMRRYCAAVKRAGLAIA